jgi:hypothetical protein
MAEHPLIATTTIARKLERKNLMACPYNERKTLPILLSFRLTYLITGGKVTPIEKFISSIEKNSLSS